jgi:hypothetical protein
MDRTHETRAVEKLSYVSFVLVRTDTRLHALQQKKVGVLQSHKHILQAVSL